MKNRRHHRAHAFLACMSALAVIAAATAAPATTTVKPRNGDSWQGSLFSTESDVKNRMSFGVFGDKPQKVEIYERTTFLDCAGYISGAGVAGSGKIKRGKFEVVLKGRNVKATILGKFTNKETAKGTLVAEWSATGTSDGCTLSYTWKAYRFPGPASGSSLTP